MAKKGRPAKQFKGRPVTESEILAYLIGFYERGQTLTDLADEHGRIPDFVREQMEQANEKRPELVRRHIKKGLLRNTKG